MIKFVIPKIYKHGFEIFLSLDREFIDKFINEIENTPAGLLPQELSERLSESLALDENDLKLLISMIFSLYRAKEGSGIELNEFVDGILDAVAQTDELKLKINENTRENFVRMLNLSGSFLLTLKAADIIREREKLILNTRIMTDVRPVFSENSELLGSIIIHNLRIAFEEGNEIKELYFALDKNDLTLLKENIQKAETQEQVIMEKFSSAENAFIEVK